MRSSTVDGQNNFAISLTKGKQISMDLLVFRTNQQCYPILYISRNRVDLVGEIEWLEIKNYERRSTAQPLFYKKSFL
jgi:hypothetical protein